MSIYLKNTKSYIWKACIPSSAPVCALGHLPRRGRLIYVSLNQKSPLSLILPSHFHNNRKLSLDLSGAIGYNEENFIKKKRG